jgi:hypothetical protein
LPILDFSIDGVPYRSGPDVTFVIFSVVGFPDDEQRRLKWLRTAVNSRTSEQLKSFQLGEVPLLPGAPAVHHRVMMAGQGPRFDLDRDAPDFGIDRRVAPTVGFILVHALLKRGSVIGAIHSFITGDGQRASLPGASTETLKRMWRKHRPIAHLAAGVAYRRPALRHDPRTWLEWTEGLRIAGEQYRPAHAAETLLDAKATWKAPKSLGLRIVLLDQLDLPSDPKAGIIDP